MDEHKADVRQPGEGEGRNVNAPDHGKGKRQSISERLAASHGEGTRPVRFSCLPSLPCLRGAGTDTDVAQVGHDSVC